jgi:hypothetical protein
MHAFFIQKFAQIQTLSREKLLKRLLYEKCVHKMLMKLTPAVNFINVFFVWKSKWHLYFCSKKICNFIIVFNYFFMRRQLTNVEKHWSSYSMHVQEDAQQHNCKCAKCKNNPNDYCCKKDTKNLSSLKIFCQIQDTKMLQL